jgi:hypothetical protein
MIAVLHGLQRDINSRCAFATYEMNSPTAAFLPPVATNKKMTTKILSAQAMTLAMLLRLPS